MPPNTSASAVSTPCERDRLWVPEWRGVILLAENVIEVLTRNWVLHDGRDRLDLR